MIYVTSDIHGRLDLFEKMLEKINFNDNDKLFVLGDMVDRGGDLSLLSKIHKLQSKGMCIPIMGNHEKILLNILDMYTPKAEIESLIKETRILKNSFAYVNDNNIMALLQTVPKLRYLKKQSQLLSSEINLFRYFNGVAINGYISDSLNKMTRKDMIQLKEYLTSMPTGIKVEVNGKKYLLVHAGYSEVKEQTDPKHKFNIREEFFMNKVISSEPMTVVFGHTTTNNIRAIKEHTLKYPYTIWYDEEFKDKIGIDCGACYPNGQLACLCLDTMEEFYVKNNLDTIVPISYINSKIAGYRKMVDNVNAQYAPDIEHEISIFK